MPVIKVVTHIHAPIEKVFDLARSIDVHQQSQVSKKERAVAGKTEGLIEEGEWVTWEATHFGVRQRLTSQVTQMKPPTFFRDSQVSGAFQRFDHDHHFEADGNEGTIMTDVFDYTSPLGVLGRCADRWFLAVYMKKLLEERNLEVKRLAEERDTENPNF